MEDENNDTNDLNESIHDKFIKASENIKQYKTLSNDELLKLYGIYKQSLFGKNTTNKPSIFNYKGLLKWNAWTSESVLTQQEAKQEYIKYVNKLLKKINNQ
jgi:diazepam-binding inhibitor (GABA receptor modulator, acyl-CoA-binding protein)